MKIKISFQFLLTFFDLESVDHRTKYHAIWTKIFFFFFIKQKLFAGQKDGITSKLINIADGACVNKHIFLFAFLNCNLYFFVQRREEAKESSVRSTCSSGPSVLSIFLKLTLYDL